MNKRFTLLTAFSFFILFASELSYAKKESDHYPIEYSFEINNRHKTVNVEISLTKAKYIKSLDFNLTDSQCKNFRSDDNIQTESNRLLWTPSGKQSWLRYQCKIKHKRPSNKQKNRYDAFIDKDWAIFRGDDMVPPAKVRFKKTKNLQARLRFSLPNGWTSVNTGWPKESVLENTLSYIINNPERNFDRPTGWIIAGKLGTRRTNIQGKKTSSNIAVSAPIGSNFRRMDTLTFLQFVWPQLEHAFNHTPPDLLVVGAGKPMWRGGLSAGNSFYLHADRPLVSENGTSTLLHELFHMTTDIRGKKNADWIAEGLAEYYAIELLYRAGGMTADRRKKTLKKLEAWSKGVKSFETSSSKGATTASAVLFFVRLNQELSEQTGQSKAMDLIVRELMKTKKVGKEDLADAYLKVAGVSSELLDNL